MRSNATHAVTFGRPKLFTSAFTRRIVDSDGQLLNVTANDMTQEREAVTSSFRYDPPGAGLRSSQQLPVDWSDFSRHTFFNSAEAKVNVAFDNIINKFPFDGTCDEYEIFVDSLTGFEKWVLDEFPTNMGYLIFSGSHISVNPFAGSNYSSIAKNDSGDNVLEPGDKSITLEMHLYITGAANDNQVICQHLSNKADGDYGLSVMLSSSVSLTTGPLHFIVTSGSSYMSCSHTVSKGVWHHLAFEYDRTSGVNTLSLLSGSTTLTSSLTAVEMGSFGFTSENMLIGSGTSHAYGSYTITPQETFLGRIDEFRLYHSARSADDLVRNADRNVFASDDLILYYKFNEPSGTLGGNSDIVLDSSGNSLHSNVTNFDLSLRETGSMGAVPLRYESSDYNPVLFPGHEGVVDLNTDLLASASIYDQANPNLITKLIPSHYLEEGQGAEALNDVDGDIGDAYEGGDSPGTGKLGSAQLLAALLYVWAKHFDEFKLFNDHLSNINFVSFDEFETVADTFLPRLFRHYGLDAPTMFSNATLSQFVNAENIGSDYDINSMSLMKIQNTLWRRILVNLDDILRSKGTLHSVKSMLRAVGIDPDSTVRIREYGGSTVRNLEEAFQKRSVVIPFLDFSGTVEPSATTYNAQGIPSNKPFIISGFMSASRVETGFPDPVGPMVNAGESPVHGVSSDPSDGLMTSGSWTVELQCKYAPLVSASHPTTQSLVRLVTTGSARPTHRVVCNLLACTGSDPKIKLYANTYIFTPPLEIVEMELTGTNIFDGDIWSVSFGRMRSDDVGVPMSSSWFLRAAKQNVGEISEQHTTSTFYYETDANEDVFRWQAAAYNVSGVYAVVGHQQLVTASAASGLFLNDDTVTGSEPLSSDFSGRLANLRFWSRTIDDESWLSHVRDLTSVGVKDPSTGFNFVTQPTGAFGRLRLDLSMDQPTTQSDSQGRVTLTDFSQGGKHASGTGFEVSKRVFVPEHVLLGALSPYFDEATSDNKVRVRSYLSDANVELYGGESAPVSVISPSERPADDVRLSIDFSAVNALNEDIVRIFSTLDSLDTALGDPRLLHADDYPSLETMRDVYFNRLTDVINLKGFFEYFRWFDSSMGVIIAQLLPRKTKFMGTNFVIESHMLERSKVRYNNEERHMPHDVRSSTIATVLTDMNASVS